MIMVQFYGYNDARAIAAYNKHNLTKMFFIFALICCLISIIAIAIPLYELLYVWGVFLFLLLLILFACSLSKYDDKALKEKGIKTKYLFIIDEFKLFRDHKELKEKENIKFYAYQKYILLYLKKSYYYIPKDELTISIRELIERLREVIYGISIEKIILETKKYIDNNLIKGRFKFTKDSIIWELGIHRFTFYIDYHETIIYHDKFRFNKFYINYTHYHVDNSDINNTINILSNKWGKKGIYKS